MAHRQAKPSRKKARKPIFNRKLTYGTIIIVITIAVFFAYSLLRLRSSNPASNGQTHSNRAALVDQLSISEDTRNDTFKQDCLSILNASGFNVTYHRGEDVTVNFYRNLPSYDYSLIVFRVHSAEIKNATGGTTGGVGMFTSERYNESNISEHEHELLVDAQLAIAKIFQENETYFGITPRFVQKSMIGRFKNTTIIMMGCDGLKYTTMAAEFIGKGAKVYISWNGLVLMSHSDQSTIHLLRNLLQEKLSVGTSVVWGISIDPTYQSSLDYYPHDSGGYVIPDMSALALILQAKCVFVSFVGPKHGYDGKKDTAK